MPGILSQILSVPLALIHLIDSYLPPLNTWCDDVLVATKHSQGNEKKAYKSKFVDNDDKKTKRGSEHDQKRPNKNGNHEPGDSKHEQMAYLEIDTKFWECHLEGTTTRVRYGKIGTVGRLGKLVRFDNEDDALKDFNKQVSQRSAFGVSIREIIRLFCFGY
jgi:predicted DNA-binding WGR domain protein